MPRLPTWIRTRQQQPNQRPLRIGVAIASALAVAIGAAVVLAWGALSLFKPTSVREHLDVIKIALSVIAGIGGVVALVVAYRRQLLAEEGETREQSKLYAERFDKASDKLGSDSAAVRLAGVHALASLADDWEEGRQTCIDVLCAYLRMPYSREPDAESDPDKHADWLAMQEVRATIFRLIATHLKRNTALSWGGSNIDFSGVTFDTDTDFGDIVISGGQVSFTDARFSGGMVNFAHARFCDGTVNFAHARFSKGTVNFGGAEFSGGMVNFEFAEFSGGEVNFGVARFSGGMVNFASARFSGGMVSFGGARFSGGEVSFVVARFSGGEVSFGGAEFSGGTVDFSRVADWSHPPQDLPFRPHDIVAWPNDDQDSPHSDGSATEETQ